MPDLNTIYIHGSESYHPYECDGPGKCIHCDGTVSVEHDPARCWLCHDGPPPGMEQKPVEGTSYDDGIEKLFPAGEKDASD